MTMKEVDEIMDKRREEGAAAYNEMKRKEGKPNDPLADCTTKETLEGEVPDLEEVDIETLK